jgi:hypothetical protein
LHCQRWHCRSNAAANSSGSRSPTNFDPIVFLSEDATDAGSISFNGILSIESVPKKSFSENPFKALDNVLRYRMILT